MSSSDPYSVYYNTDNMTEEQLYQKFINEGYRSEIARKLARGERIGNYGGRSRRRRTGRRRRRRTGRRRR